MSQEEPFASGLPLPAIKAAVLRHKWLSLAILATSVFSALVYTSWQTPLYMAQSSVRIEDRPRVIVGSASAGEWMDTDMLKAQQQLAQSRPVLELAADSAGPEVGSTDLKSASMVLARGSTQLHGNLLYLKALHPDPQRAAQLANAWMDAYTEETKKRERMYPLYTSTFLKEDVLNKLQKEWYSQQSKLKQFKLESTYDPKEFDKHPVRNRYGTLSEKWTTAREHLDTLRGEAKAWHDAEADAALLAQQPRVREDLKMRDLEQQLFVRRQKYIEVKQLFLPTSSEYQSSESAFQEYDALVRQKLGEIALQIKADLRAAEDQVKSLSAFFEETKKEYNDLMSQANQFNVLSSEEQSAREAYEKYARRQMEAEVEARVGISYIQPWERAEIPCVPIWPNWPRNIMLGVILGLALAAGATYLSEILDDTVRSTKQLQERMGLNVLGAIQLGEGHAHSNQGYFQVRDFPRSLMVENLRALRNSLTVAYMRNGSKPERGTLVLVTSSGENEGKTFLASNLAQLFAVGNKKVLLVDMDLHKGTLSKALGQSNQVGLGDLAHGPRPLKDLASPSLAAGIDILSKGVTLKNPSVVIESPYFAQLLKEARRDYDVIIIDSPPLLAVADAGLIAPLCDLTLVTVRSRHTRKSQVEHVAEILGRAQIKEKAYLLNGLDSSDASAGGYGYRYGNEYLKPYGGEHQDQGQREEPSDLRTKVRS